MSVHVSGLVWEYSRASKSNLLVMLALADSSDDTGRCYLSISTIAQKARVCARQAGDSVRELAAAGELWISEGTGPNGCNEYVILWARAYAEGVELPEPVYVIGSRKKNGRPRGSRNTTKTMPQIAGTGANGAENQGADSGDNAGTDGEKPSAFHSEGAENPLHFMQNPLHFVQKTSANHSEPSAFYAKPPAQNADKPYIDPLDNPLVGTVNKPFGAIAPTTDKTPFSSTPTAAVPPSRSGKDEKPEKPMPASGVFLPKGWLPDADSIAWAKGKYPAITDEFLADSTERFTLHYAAKTGSDAKSRDWQATWCKWVAGSVRFAEKDRQERRDNQPVDNRTSFQPTPKTGVPAATQPQPRRTMRTDRETAAANVEAGFEDMFENGGFN